jgi:hypothetical protein
VRWREKPCAADGYAMHGGHVNTISEICFA